MKIELEIKEVKTLKEIEGYWKEDDFANLLKLFDYPDVDSLPRTEWWDMLSMAIADFEPDEAAAIVLQYKLGDVLNDGQISHLSNEMLEDKVAEEYPDIALHYPLFNINQLLFDAYNGKFPRTMATALNLVLRSKEKVEYPINKEIALRAMAEILNDHCIIKRLYADQLKSAVKIGDAEHIFWEMENTGPNQYRILTSDYWLNDEDFNNMEFVGSIRTSETIED